MALPKPPKGRGHPLKKAKPTEAELAGIRKRSAARHGGKSLGEDAVLRTWQNNQQRKATAKGRSTAAKRTGIRPFSPASPGSKKVDHTPSTGPTTARKVPGLVHDANPGSLRTSVTRTTVGKVRGKSAAAPGRARGNPTPGVPRGRALGHSSAGSAPKPMRPARPTGSAPLPQAPKVRGKSALAPGRVRGNPTPGVPRTPAPAKLGFSERPEGATRIFPTPPAKRKRVGS